MKILSSFVLVAATFVFSPILCQANVVTITSDAEARLVTEPNGNRDDNNGGNTASGRLIGRNGGGVDNFMIFNFNASLPVAGLTVTGATVTIDAAPQLPPNAGTSADTIVLSQIASGNFGWNAGSDAIGGQDNPANDGSVSYLFRETFEGTPPAGTSVQWVDSSGASVANVTGAFTTLGTTPGYNASPATISFNINQATAQDWATNGLAGLALSALDDGNNLSRFNFATGGISINFDVAKVPEPSAGLLSALAIFAAASRRRR